MAEFEPLQAVSQDTTSFFIPEGADPKKREDKFLKYVPETNEYVWASYADIQAEGGLEAQAGQIGALKIAGGGDGQSNIGEPDQDTTSSITGGLAQNVEGSIHSAAAGFNAFSTFADVVSTPGVAAKAITGLSSISGVKDSFDRAAALEAAQAPNATIADSLRGYQARASAFDIASNVAITALSAFTGNAIGTIGGLLGLASDVASRKEAEASLSRAAEMEQEAAITGKPTAYGFGYVNTAKNFQEQQAKNLAAAQTTPTKFSALTAQETIAGALSSATSMVGPSGYGGYGGYGSDSTGSLGGYSVDATNPGYDRSSFGKSTGGDGGGGGGFGTAGGYGAEGHAGTDASQTGADPDGGNVA
jgi:hypothetical protein